MVVVGGCLDKQVADCFITSKSLIITASNFNVEKKKSKSIRRIKLGHQRVKRKFILIGCERPVVTFLVSLQILSRMGAFVIGITQAL